MPIAYLLYGGVISIGAGYVCAAVRKTCRLRTVWFFASNQSCVRIGVEVSYWEITPAWYHVAFLTLWVPATVWGGTRRAARS